MIRRDWLGKRPPHDSEQRQAGEKVDQQVQRMVAPHVQAADCVVEREGKIEQRPAADRDAAARWLQRRRELPDGPVQRNRIDVVEDQRPGKAVHVSGESGEDEHGAGDQLRPAGRTGAW